MKIFPIKHIKPQNGILEAKIFENSLVNIHRQLFFQITIPLEEFTIAGEPYPINTAFVLDWIRLEIKNLSDLENRTLHFPINPKTDYIDGSVYLFDAHNLLYVSELRFGKFQNQHIPVEAKLQIDFEYEGTGFKNTEVFTIKTNIALGELLIWNDVLAPTEKNLLLANIFVSQFIDNEGFGEPFLDGFGIRIQMDI